MEVVAEKEITNNKITDAVISEKAYEMAEAVAIEKAYNTAAHNIL